MNDACVIIGLSKKGKGIPMTPLNSSLSIGLSQLNSLSDKLTKSGLPADKRQKILNKLTEKIHDLRIHIPTNLAANHSAKHEIAKSLEKIDTVLGNDFSSSTRELRNEINTIRLQVVGLQLGCFFDFTGPDFNGLITLGMVESIHMELPFVATRSLLRGDALNETNPMMSDFLYNVLVNTQKDWDIFIQEDMKEGEGLVLFIPKSLHSDKIPSEKLKALDFNTDGTLKPAKIFDVLAKTGKNGNAKSLATLFAEEPTVSKTVILNGHGNAQTIGGLNQSDLQLFRSVLDKQNVKGMLIISCMSGGASSLQLNEVHTNYPIILRSVGDFTTERSYVWGNKGIKSEYTDSIASSRRILAQLPLTSTYKNYSQLIDKEDNSDKSNQKLLQNYVTVYLPSSPSVPDGFRAIDEQGGSNYILTIQKLRRKQIKTVMDRNHKAPKSENTIKIKDSHALQLYPQVITVPIVITGKYPILLSMVPGNAHHYIESIEADEGTLQKFFAATENFYQKNQLSTQKAFFINRINTGSQQYQEVVFAKLDILIALYKKKGRYVQRVGDTVGEIDAFSYSLMKNLIISATQPSKQALASATANQESDDQFLDALSNSLFRKTAELKISDLNPFQKFQLVSIYLTSRKHDQALEFIINEKVDLITPVGQNNLVNLAASTQANRIVQYAIEQKLPIDTNHLFMIACQTQNHALIEILLSAYPSIIILQTTPTGWPPFAMVLDNPAIRKSLGDNPNLNIVNGDESLLSHMVKTDNAQNVFYILKHNVDLTLGNLSPLTHAIRSKLPQYIDPLLKQGCDPFKPDKSNSIPMMEAVKEGSVEIVRRFLNHPNIDLNIRDSFNCHLYFEMLNTGNREMITLLKQKGIKPPEPLLTRDLDDAEAISRKLERFGENALRNMLIQDLLKSTTYSYERILSRVNPAYIIKLMKTEKISYTNPWINALFIGQVNQGNLKTVVEIVKNLPEIVKDRQIGTSATLLELASNLNDDGAMFRFLVESGAVLNDPGYKASHPATRYCCHPTNQELFEFCLNKGLQLNAEQLEMAFDQVLGSGDPKMIKYFFSRFKFVELKDWRHPEFFFAYERGGVAYLRALIEVGIDINKIPEGYKRRMKELMIKQNDQASLALFS